MTTNLTPRPEIETELTAQTLLAQIPEVDFEYRKKYNLLEVLSALDPTKDINAIEESLLPDDSVGLFISAQARLLRATGLRGYEEIAQYISGGFGVKRYLKSVTVSNKTNLDEQAYYNLLVGNAQRIQGYIETVLRVFVAELDEDNILQVEILNKLVEGGIEYRPDDILMAMGAVHWIYDETEVGQGHYIISPLFRRLIESIQNNPFVHAVDE